jgi:hypothetical protein
MRRSGKKNVLTFLEEFHTDINVNVRDFELVMAAGVMSPLRHSVASFAIDHSS